MGAQPLSSRISGGQDIFGGSCSEPEVSEQPYSFPRPPWGRTLHTRQLDGYAAAALYRGGRPHRPAMAAWQPPCGYRKGLEGFSPAIGGGAKPRKARSGACAGYASRRRRRCTTDSLQHRPAGSDAPAAAGGVVQPIPYSTDPQGLIRQPPQAALYNRFLTVQTRRV
jgi:hypothetical protein